MRIGQVAERAGVAASAIRFYESRGLLPQPARVSGQRNYDGDVLDRLAVIQLAQRAGFSLEEIKLLMTGFSPQTPPSERWRVLARQKLPEVEALLARITTMKSVLEAGLDCRCVSLDDCQLPLRR